ncbi:hypothetical protein [Microtetraspora fusca]|uniref:hypothetical protein n=1 Tax=Microtetraspora fusca TaxID=1997 RepID=UPI0008371F71|nr:hypothetical protein [Microtetraspora fusca]
MIKKMPLKAGVVAVAVAAGLITSAPSANAAGNCTHYEKPGYAQLFTDPYYQGDCFEYSLGTYIELPSYVKNKVSSLRSWSNSPLRSVWLYGDPDLVFRAGPNEWWPSLPSWIDDKADFAS